ncbi:MAG: hypothetical protein JWR49_2077, partial [Tardiphaga sp.]|nr:hypothetical protein [Tardiphaga sp.]
MHTTRLTLILVLACIGLSAAPSWSADDTVPPQAA